MLKRAHLVSFALGRTLVAIAMSGCYTKPPEPVLGSGGDGGTTGVAPNVAFVTSTPQPLSQLTNLADADRWCTNAATAGGLDGTYRAWMSTSSESAQSRFGTARGWVRTDGKPFADSIDDLVTTGRMFYPLRFDEAGNDLMTTDPTGSHLVATGTMKTGIVDQNCVDLTGAGSMTYGFADAEGSAWTDASTASCGTSSLRIYCLGVDRMSRVDPPSTAGPRIFLSDTPILVGTMGVNAFDTRCASDAAAANPPLNGEFRALVALAQSSALQRVGAMGQTWVRVDGVEVTKDFAAIEAPVNVTARGRYLDGVVTWNGAADASAQGTSTCGDWAVNSSGLAAVGDIDRTNSDAFGRAGIFLACSLGTVHIYCAEVQQ